MKVCILVILALIGQASACTGALPPNLLYLPPTLKSDVGLTEAQFNASIDKVFAVYGPELVRAGFNVTVVKNWESPLANAFSTMTGELTFHGGLARMSTITAEALMVIACHEVGHLLGGAPRLVWQTLPAIGFAPSSEGQSDYFATLKCMRKVLQHEDNVSFLKGKQIPETVAEECSEMENPELCQRSSLAALDLGYLFANLKGESISFETPDPYQVSRTILSYAGTQCRLDTFFQGAICTVSENEDIPLVGDETTGVCHPRLDFTKGNRPACWYTSTEL
jgi:hypothetical protein